MIENWKNIAAIAVALIVCLVSFSMGYGRAQTEGELEIERLKLAQADEIINAQNNVRMQYDEKIETLVADLASARDLNDKRVRQLESFRNADRDLAACSRDRRDLAELAVRGERLLKDAESYIRALRE